MELANAGDPAAFKRFEADGWSERAESYRRLTGRATAAACAALLDAAGVEAHDRVLDLGCGPGHLSLAASRLGARPVGLDLAEGMLAEARRACPGIEFVAGDAERLPFADDDFDAVFGGFVLNHLPRPEVAAAEAARVARPGARVAFAVWDRPERARLIGLLGDAVAAAGGDRSVGPPPGPDEFRFAADTELAVLLSGAGLSDVGVRTLELSVEAAGAEELWEGLLGGCVRAPSAVLGLPSEMRERVREAFHELAAPFTGPGGGLTVPAVVKIGSGGTR